MTKFNNEITLQVGDQCRVLEDNPYDADIFEGDVVTVTSVTGDGISVLDNRNIEWHLDESKVEPIGINELDIENSVIELPENFEITDKKGNKFIAKREQDSKIFPGIIDVEKRFLDGETHFALPYDELSKGSQYVITKYAEKPTIEVDLGEAADDVISDLSEYMVDALNEYKEKLSSTTSKTSKEISEDLESFMEEAKKRQSEIVSGNVKPVKADNIIIDKDEHLSESVDDFYLNVADKVIEESKERDFDEYYGEAESLKTERVYLAGPISTEGDVMYMSYLAEELRNLGYHVHAPHEDESINDKTNDPSADDIFANDTDAIDSSDIIVLVESGREQVGTHMEAGKIIERIEQGAPLELVVFTSNYRVEDTQIEDGKASASVNHYALGGYKRAGTWIDGMSAGMLEYMKERKEPKDKRELFESLPLHVQEFNEGDTLIDRNSEEEYVIENIRYNSLGDYSEVILKNVNNGNLTADPARIVPTYYVKRTEDGLIVDKANEVAYYEEYDCEKEFQNLTDEEFGIFVGDIFVTKDGITRLKVKELLEHTLVFEVLNTAREETLHRSYSTILDKEYLKRLDDGRLINYSAEIVYKDIEHATQELILEENAEGWL